MLNLYVAQLYSRHSGEKKKVGVRARTMKSAVKLLEREVGQVLYIEKRENLPRNVLVEYSTFD